MLDFNLAKAYGVEMSQLKHQKDITGNSLMERVLCMKQPKTNYQDANFAS